MRRSQIEHIKTALLVVLVITSFVFSGYLWYSTPASEVLKPDNDVPPYIFKSPLYSNRARHELIAPFQIVIHQPNHTSMILPDESSDYKNMEKMAHQLEIDQFEEIRPTKQEWLTVSRSVGIELLFLRDASYELIESFFGNAIPYQSNGRKITEISRIWIFHDTRTKNVRVWLLSEKTQKVAEGYSVMNDKQLEHSISTISLSHAKNVLPVTLEGSLPWDTNSTSFSRVFYLPSSHFHMKSLSFQTENINIDNMKQWLFRDPEIKPLIPNADESFYMYNDQLLNFNNRFNYMTYNDSSNTQSGETRSLPNQLDQIKNFVQRHQGWTGFYLLEEVQKGELYLFRLFKQGYPVYWKNTDAVHNIHPDLIQLHTGDSGVSKYIRSMYYLSGKPTELETVSLPGKVEIIKALSRRGIPLNAVERVFPGYTAKEQILNQKKQIQLNPVWVIYTTDGKKVFIS